MLDDEPSTDSNGVKLGRLSHFIGFRLRRAQNQLSRDFFARARAYDLRGGMFSALEIIASNPGMSQAALSVALDVDKSALVLIVDDLERRKWVVRSKSTEDRRRNHLRITELGERKLTELVETMAHSEAKAFAALTDTERQVISKALNKVFDAYSAKRPK